MTVATININSHSLNTPSLLKLQKAFEVLSVRQKFEVITLRRSKVMLICFFVHFNKEESSMEPVNIKHIICEFLKVWLSRF